MRKLKIGLIGSMLDTKFNKKLKTLAIEVGKEIARNKAVLVFGFEPDFESLPMIAAKSAENAGGETIAFLESSQKPRIFNLKSRIVLTGLKRGGGREFPFILSCNVVICIAGGSGTLMEIAMAYQAGIPVIVLQNSGGWSAKLANQFLDERKREKIIGANSSKRAVAKALNAGFPL